MKIKKANLVSREDIEGLLRNLDFCIMSILENKQDNALWTLTRLRDNLENNLIEQANRELEIHDKVRVVKIAEMDQLDYLNKEGWIVGIDNDYEYPYSIQFDDGSDEWLWKREQLELI